MAACDLLLGLGIVFAVGGFGGTAVFKMGQLSIAGAAGVVMIILSVILPC